MLPLLDERWLDKEYILVTDTMDLTDLGVEDHFLTNIYRAEVLLQPQLLAPGSFTLKTFILSVAGRLVIGSSQATTPVLKWISY